LPDEHWPCERTAEIREDVVIELPEESGGAEVGPEL
jgi:hypothetical protein